MASFASAASRTAKSGKPHRDLAEKRGNPMLPVVFHPANQAAALAIRPPNGMTPGLRGNNLLLEARQQQLPFCQRQTESGDIVEIIRPADRHHINGLFLTLSPNFHQPQNPSHASTLDQRLNAKLPLGRSHPQSLGSSPRRPGRRPAANDSAGGPPAALALVRPKRAQAQRRTALVNLATTPSAARPTCPLVPENTGIQT